MFVDYSYFPADRFPRHPCPSCGYCPTCGRKSASPYEITYYHQPYLGPTDGLTATSPDPSIPAQSGYLQTENQNEG